MCFRTLYLPRPWHVAKLQVVSRNSLSKKGKKFFLEIRNILNSKKWRSNHHLVELISHASNRESSLPLKVRNEIKLEVPLERDNTAFIDNAGIVLVWPFLITLFEYVELYSNNSFHSEAGAERACVLLQYLATGEDRIESDHFLVLNKILCGLPINHPIDTGIQLSGREQKVADELLSRVIETWSVLGSTSIEGLRSTFLSRRAMIVDKEDRINLLVEHNAFDVLIDKIPWSISVIKFQHMNKPLYIHWRNK